MAQGFFKHIPNIQYDFKSDGKFYQAKDLFRKVSVWNYLKEGVAGYSYYRITEGERPDVVAAKLYGDSTLYWLFWLVNENLQDHNDWPKSQQLFQKFLDRKYPGKCLVASNSTDIVTSTNKFTLGEKVSQSSTAYGFVTDVNPTHNRITVQIPTASTDSFTAGATVTGASSEKSFTISSVKNERDAINHYTTMITSIVNGVVSSSTNVVLNAPNSLIEVGQTVTGAGISGSTAVSAINGTALTLASAHTITDNTVLSFGTSDIRTTVSTNNVAVTNEEYELDLNEEKHIIQYIPAGYAARVVRDFSSLVRS